MIKFTPELKAYIDAELKKADQEYSKGEYYTLEEAMGITKRELEKLYAQERLETKNIARSN